MGLKWRCLTYLDDESLSILCDSLNRARDNGLEGEDLIHMCKGSAMYKGKGSANDPSCYRYLIVSAIMGKLLNAVCTERV